MAKATAGERARRLIALLGRLEPGAALPIASLASELGTTEEDLATDLQTLSLCGVAPYYPDQMLDVFVENGAVEVYTPLPAVTGAIRLAPTEARALAAALQAAGFDAGDGLVSRLLASASAGFDAEELERTLRAQSSPHESGVYATLASAIERRIVVRISYRDRGGEAGDREIEPLALVAERGAWYVQAWCRSVCSERTFRLDRIVAAETTSERFDRVLAGGPSGVLASFDAAELPVARLAFEAGERYIEREWPGARVVEGDETVTLVEVPFAGTAWIARQVASRLGAVAVVSPDEVRLAVAELAAHESSAQGASASSDC